MAECIDVEGLDQLAFIAHVHEGEGEDYFVTNALPFLASYPEAELWALAGFFLSSELIVQARFVARYASLIRALDHPGDPRPNPLAEWADWRFRTPEGGPRMPTSAEIAEGVAELLSEHYSHRDNQGPRQ